MSFDNVISSMNQQTRVIKDLKELLAHNDKQTDPGHSVPTEDVELLRTYVETMETAVNTAKALAQHYKGGPAPKPAENKPETTAPAKPEPPAAEAKEAPKTEKPKRKRNAAKAQEAPAAEAPVPEEPVTQKPEDEFDFLG